MDEEKLATANNISLKEAKKLVKSHITSNIKNPSFTRSVYFDLDRVTNMVEKIKAEGGDGVRIYFGQYTDEIISEANGEIPTYYKDRATLLFVSTKNKKDYFTQNLTPPINRGTLCPPDSGCDDDSEILKG